MENKREDLLKFETPFGIFYKDEPIEIILGGNNNVIGLFGGIIQNEENNENSIIVNEPMRCIINGYDYAGTGYKINYVILPFSVFSYTSEITIPFEVIIKINRINKDVYNVFGKPHINNFMKDITELDNLTNIFITKDLDIIKYKKLKNNIT